jgi:hypothetical protein
MTKKQRTSQEFKRFDSAMRGILKVSHGEIKEKLDAEKTAKKRKKLKVSGASREAV